MILAQMMASNIGNYVLRLEASTGSDSADLRDGMMELLRGLPELIGNGEIASIKLLDFFRKIVETLKKLLGEEEVEVYVAIDWLIIYKWCLMGFRILHTSEPDTHYLLSCWFDMVDILDKYKQYEHLSLTDWMSAINFCISCKHRIIVDDHFRSRFGRFVLCFVARDLSSLSKETLDELNTVISSDLIPAADLEALSNVLFRAIEGFLENKNFEKAKKLSVLCCKASWSFLICLSQMYIDLKTINIDNDMSPWIVHMLEKCCIRTNRVLVIFHLGDAKNIIVESLHLWAFASTLFRSLPFPATLMQHWVKLACIYGDHEQHLYKFLTKIHEKKNICIIMEQEHNAYDEMKVEYPVFAEQMQKLIRTQLLHLLKGSEDCWLQHVRILRLSTSKEEDECLEFLTKKIDSWGENHSHQLAVAYCLRGFRLEEVNPYSAADSNQEVLRDIKKAIEIWSLNPTEVVMSEYLMVLLNNIIDLLSIKGFSDFQELHKIMFSLFEWMNVPREKCLARLWATRRISHALCPSPVNNEFIKYSGEGFQSIRTWFDILKESELSLLIAWQQNFTSTFSNFCCGTFPGNIFPSRLTLDKEVKATASSLISHDEPQSIYLAAYLYYDLSERLSSNGDLIKAQFYAEKAFDLRRKLCLETFYNLDAEEQILQVQSQVAGAVWSSDTVAFDLNKFCLGPWNLVKCYLESTLQLGIMREVNGNGFDAHEVLMRGLDMSITHNLPLFVISFSSVLGKIFHKMGQWKKAKKRINWTIRFFEKFEDKICCLKCRLTLGVRVYQNLHDLHERTFDRKKSASIERSSDAQNPYEAELCKLSDPVWNSSLCFIEDQTSRAWCTLEICRSADSDMLVHLKSYEFPLGSEGTCICNGISCWLCVPIDVTKSELVENFIDLRWEFERRRLSLRLLTQSGKYLESRGRFDELHTLMLQSISILVSKSPSSHSSFIPLNFLELMGKEIPGDALRIERAELLHNIFCWSQKIRHSQEFRPDCHPCHIIHADPKKLVSWLVLAFVLCREVPALFQKVSRMLAAIFSIYVSQSIFLLANQNISTCWASYFQQASLGSHVCGSTENGSRTQNTKGSHSLAPESIRDLEKFIEHFFKKCPQETVICVSLVEGTCASLLRQFLGFHLLPHAWILISYLNCEKTLVCCQPISKILEGDPEDLTNFGRINDWDTLWTDLDSTEVDKLAPEFRLIVDGMDMLNIDDQSFTKFMFDRLDSRFGEFLKNLEETWFMPLIDVVQEHSNQEPIIFVLGLELQMLPLESLAMFRGKEVYRMPSIGWILETMEKNAYQKQSVGKFGNASPFTDSVDVFCLLDASLRSDLILFKRYLLRKNFKVYDKSNPCEDELVKDLGDKDLFIYLGHGSGHQYIDNDRIRKLHRSAAVCLMGCSSAAVRYPKGQYFPECTPFDYLSAGAAFVVSTLWLTYGLNNKKMTKYLINSLVEQRSHSLVGKVMSHGRDVTLSERYLAGAAYVCYGIPPGVTQRASNK